MEAGLDMHPRRSRGRISSSAEAVIRQRNTNQICKGIPFRLADIRQIRFPQIFGLRFRINGFAILHGR
jgi:hypothetical protein